MMIVGRAVALSDKPVRYPWIKDTSPVPPLCDLHREAVMNAVQAERQRRIGIIRKEGKRHGDAAIAIARIENGESE